MMFGYSARLIGEELSGKGTMSSLIPKLSTRSRSRVRAATNYSRSSGRDGRELQMGLTPRPAKHAGRHPTSDADGPRASAIVSLSRLGGRARTDNQGCVQPGRSQ